MYGKLIVRYCQDKHITYKEFAKLCGVNVRSIYRWINGSTIKGKATELKLCELLGVEIPQAKEIFEDTSDTFYIFPEEKQPTKVIQIGEDYYTMLRELAFKSKTSLRYVAEMCIDFAAARYRG